MSDADIDIALSFAGEDRVYVDDVAHALRDAGVRVFYDQFELVDLLGRNLVQYLEDVYRRRARFVAVFVSRHYARRMWTVFERDVLQARSLEDRSDYLIPIRLDGAKLPGILSTIGLVDGRRYTGPEVAKLLATKVAPEPSETAARVGPVPSAGIPMTVDAKVRLVSFRPPGWEHLLLAGVVWQAAEALEPDRMDLELAHAGRTGEHVGAPQLPGRVDVWLDELTAITGRLAALVQPARLAWALGRPGEPGDATRIEHLGRRFGQTYGELLDWHRRVAGVATDRDSRLVLVQLARLADRPVRQTRAFVDDLVDAARMIAEGYRTNAGLTTVPIGLALDLDVARLDDFLATFASTLSGAG
jgi:hypothetical protein